MPPQLYVEAFLLSVNINFVRGFWKIFGKDLLKIKRIMYCLVSF